MKTHLSRYDALMHSRQRLDSQVSFPSVFGNRFRKPSGQSMPGGRSQAASDAPVLLEQRGMVAEGLCRLRSPSFSIALAPEHMDHPALASVQNADDELGLFAAHQTARRVRFRQGLWHGDHADLR